MSQNIESLEFNVTDWILFFIIIFYPVILIDVYIGREVSVKSFLVYRGASHRHAYTLMNALTQRQQEENLLLETFISSSSWLMNYPAWQIVLQQGTWSTSGDPDL